MAMSLCIYLGLCEINTRWGNKVNLVLVAYQTTEQLRTSGCETQEKMFLFLWLIQPEYVRIQLDDRHLE